MILKWRRQSLAALALLPLLFSCLKEKTVDNPTVDPRIEIQTHNDDQNSVSYGLDELTTDLSTALENQPSFSGRTQNVNSICGANAVPDTAGNTWKITLTFNGNNCAGTHYRTGVVVLSVPAGTRWKIAGATLTAQIQNLKVKRLSDNKSITLNGTQTFTNVNGGLLHHLATQSPIVHTLAGNNLSVTFDDGTQRTWQVARKKTFTYNNGIVATVSGTGTASGIANATEWGTNRFGRPFVTAITQPLVFRQDCNGRLTAGEIRHESFFSSQVTFGLNSNGTPTSCPTTGSYFMRLVWTGMNGSSMSAILPY